MCSRATTFGRSANTLLFVLKNSLAISQLFTIRALWTLIPMVNIGSYLCCPKLCGPVVGHAPSADGGALWRYLSINEFGCNNAIYITSLTLYMGGAPCIWSQMTRSWVGSNLNQFESGRFEVPTNTEKKKNIWIGYWIYRCPMIPFPKSWHMIHVLINLFFNTWCNKILNYKN